MLSDALDDALLDAVVLPVDVVVEDDAAEDEDAVPEVDVELPFDVVFEVLLLLLLVSLDALFVILRSAYAFFILPSELKMPKYASTVSGSCDCSALYGESKPAK